MQFGAVDAFHRRLTLEGVWLGEDSPLGTLGSAVHGVAPSVVTAIDGLAAETFPAVSRARTA